MNKSKSHKNKYKLPPQPFADGGQAQIYKAINKITGELVAFKRVKNSYKKSLSRMRREIEICNSVIHPNIMPIIDFSTSYTWYTMPLAKNTLGNLNPPIGLDLILKIITDCAHGLNAAHKKGFIHRDLSPNNILELFLNNESTWVVADWGFVRKYDQTTSIYTRTGDLLGTLGFIAPELWDDAHNATTASDIYSLGCIISWCVTGKYPLPNKPPTIEGPLSELVSLMTASSTNERLPSIEETLHYLSKIDINAPPSESTSFIYNNDPVYSPLSKSFSLYGSDIESNIIELDIDADGRPEYIIIGEREISVEKRSIKGIENISVEPMNFPFMRIRKVFLFDVDNDGIEETICILEWDVDSAIMCYKYRDNNLIILHKIPNTLYPYFVGASIIDIDKDGRVEITDEQFTTVPDHLIPENYQSKEGMLGDWGRIKYTWRWNKNLNGFERINEELMHIGQGRF